MKRDGGMRGRAARALACMALLLAAGGLAARAGEAVVAQVAPADNTVSPASPTTGPVDAPPPDAATDEQPVLAPGPRRDAGADATGDPVIARRGDLTMTAADVRALLSHIEPASRDHLLASPSALTRVLRDYLRERALLEQAEAAHWEDNPGVAYAAEQARLQVITSTWLRSRTQPPPGYPSEDEIAAAYDANKLRLATPRERHLAQIFVAVPPDAPAPAVEAARTRIEGLRDVIETQHRDFSAVATQASDDAASAGAGGDLGWLRDSQLLPAIRDGIAALDDGSVSQPLRGPNGWHLIRVIETRPGVVPTLAELHDKLAEALRLQKQKTLAEQYLATMDKETPTRVDEIAAGKLLAP